MLGPLCCSQLLLVAPRCHAAYTLLYYCCCLVCSRVLLCHFWWFPNHRRWRRWFRRGSLIFHFFLLFSVAQKGGVSGNGWLGNEQCSVWLSASLTECGRAKLTCTEWKKKWLAVSTSWQKCEFLRRAQSWNSTCSQFGSWRKSTWSGMVFTKINWHIFSRAKSKPRR